MYDNKAAKDLKYVGKSSKRLDITHKLTGKAWYTGDYVLPGMLHACVKKSPYAHARILKIDTSKAEALTGVHAVLTGAESSYRVGLYLVDKYILARDVVRHCGEAVAAVAAETREIARKAAELIEIEYEELPPVLDPVKALEKDSPLVHPDLGEYNYVHEVFTPCPGTNIANHTKMRKGDVEKGFAEADHIIERRYSNPNVQHVPMETHVAIGTWRMDDKIHIITSAQSPFTVRNLFCHSFGLPHQNVKVTIPYIGGGFGGKAGNRSRTTCLSFV